MSGKKSFSISMRKEKKKTNIPHNNREMDEKEWRRNDHIDRERTDQNVVLKKDDIEDLYAREFGESLEKYNAKQKRKDRKIDSYYEHVKNGKKTQVQQEMIVQIGIMDDIQAGDLDPEEARDIILEWYEGFEERNPNLKVYNAVIHMDEATPHLHLNFVPVASGYKRGLEKQVSFDRAILQQDDTLDKERPYKEWRDNEVDLITDIMKKRGYGRKLVGTHENMTVDQYKRMRDRERRADEIDKAIVTRMSKIRDRERRADEIDKAIVTRMSNLDEYAVNLKQRTESLDQREQEQAQKGAKLDARARELDSRAKTLEKRETSLNALKSEIEAYAEQREQELKAKELEQAQKATELDDRARELDSRAKTLEKRETSLNALKSDFKAYAEKKTQELQEMKNNALEMCQNAQGIWAKIDDYEGLGLRAVKLTAKASRMNSETMATKLQDMQDFNAEDLEDLNEETPQERATTPKLEDTQQLLAKAVANLGKSGKQL